MPLHDHFDGPLAQRRHWTAFHGSWATYIAEYLNERLEPGFFAEPLVRFGIEIDVASWDENGEGANGSAPWNPGPPAAVLPLVVPTDLVEVQVFRKEGGPTLAGAVELVSPGNKDRPEAREAFVSKCAAFLHQGVGLIVLDVVTSRSADLHAALLQRTTSTRTPEASGALFAAAYRPLAGEDQGRLEIWHESLHVGQVLPTLPLWPAGAHPLPLDLESTYRRTFAMLRLSG